MYVYTHICIFKNFKKIKILPLIDPLTHRTATARLTQHPAATTPPRAQRAHAYRMGVTSTAQHEHTTTPQRIHPTTIWSLSLLAASAAAKDA